MQRFIFRLENVLRIRKKIEEGVEREFSRALAALLKAEAELEETVERLKDFIRENPVGEGVFTAWELVAVDNYIARVGLEIKRLKAVRSEKEAEKERVLRLLMEVRKARKVMENLKERKLERYREELEREEFLALDDVNQKIGLNKERLTVEYMPLEEL